MQGGAVEAMARQCRAAVRGATSFLLCPHCRIGMAALAAAGIDGASTALEAAALQAAALTAAVDEENSEVAAAAAATADWGWPDPPVPGVTPLHAQQRDWGKLTRWRGLLRSTKPQVHGLRHLPLRPRMTTKIQQTDP